jgi:hypothetical protein
LASMTRRAATRLAAGCALLLGVGLSACAGPQNVTVLDAGASVHFDVPPGWHRISDSSLSSEVKGSGATWMVAYEAGPHPNAADVAALDAAQPFVFAESGPLSSATSREMSSQLLRDWYLPVTSTGRRNAAAQGISLIGFRQIRDQALTLSQGVHGVRETFGYTLPGDSAPAARTDTWDIVSLTNAGQTAVFLLVVHCNSVCYNKYRTEIEQIASSVTVSDSSWAKPNLPNAS